MEVQKPVEEDEFFDYEVLFLTRPKLTQNGIEAHPTSDYVPLPPDALLLSDRELADFYEAAVVYTDSGPGSDAEETIVARRSGYRRVYFPYLASVGSGIACSAGIVAMLAFALSGATVDFWSFLRGTIVSVFLGATGCFVLAYAIICATETGMVDLSFGRLKTVVRSSCGLGVLPAVSRAWESQEGVYAGDVTDTALWRLQVVLAKIVHAAEYVPATEADYETMMSAANKLREQIIDLSWSVEAGVVELDSMVVPGALREALASDNPRAMAAAVLEDNSFVKAPGGE